MHYWKYNNFFFHFICKLLDFHVLRGVIAWSIEVLFRGAAFYHFFFQESATYPRQVLLTRGRVGHR